MSNRSELSICWKKTLEDFESNVPEPNCSYGDYQRVGTDAPTNEHCGEYLGKKGCLRVELHDKVTLDGINHKGKIWGKHIHRHCHDWLCSRCYLYGSVYREATRATERLVEAQKKFGRVEHLSISLSPSDYGLPLEEARRKVETALEARGVRGGALLFHGQRYHTPEEALEKAGALFWYWNPHFHVLGFIEGGYKCRCCKNLLVDGSGEVRDRVRCMSCDGFEGVTRRHFHKDGCIVRVFGERKSVNATLTYQLDHSTVKKNAKRKNPLTWFGCISYRKFHHIPERHVDTCPICKSEAVPIAYSGRKLVFVTDRDDPNFVPEFEADFMEEGMVVWCEVPKKRYRGGGDEYG
jgi:hypothetical protein